MYSKKEEKSWKQSVAEAVALAHALVATLVAYLGQKIGGFEQLLTDRTDYPGLMFVYKYIDFPVYYVASRFGVVWEYDLLKTVAFAAIVIIGSSLLYAIIAYLVCVVVGVLYSER